MGLVEPGDKATFRNGNGSEWKGRVIAISDGPAVLLEQASGRVMLPLAFAWSKDEDSVLDSGRGKEQET